jgi:hypothetical protein
MTTEVGRNWHKSIHFDCLVDKCPFLALNGHHHERIKHKRFKHPYYTFIEYVRGVLGNKCAGQHNLKTVYFKETIISGYF